MSGKKAKKARKNQGQRCLKVTNPILNGELEATLRKLSREAGTIEMAGWFPLSGNYGLNVGTSTLVVGTAVASMPQEILALGLLTIGIQAADAPHIYVLYAPISVVMENLARAVARFGTQHCHCDDSPFPHGSVTNDEGWDIFLEVPETSSQSYLRYHSQWEGSVDEVDEAVLQFILGKIRGVDD